MNLDPKFKTPSGGRFSVGLKQFLVSPLSIFLVSFFLPFTILVVAHTYKIDPTDDYYGFGWEMGRVAASIASGQGFASPYPLSSGPTALVPPGYPYLLAGVFKVFGVYSSVSAFVALTLNCLFVASTSVILFQIGGKVFNRTAAALAGWGCALNPFAAYLASAEFWDSCLTGLLVTLIVMAVFRMGASNTSRAWLGFGVLCGIAALTNPTVLSVLPLFWIWKGWQLRRDAAHLARPIGMTLLGFLLALAPWQLRNYMTFGKMMPLRSGFGLELYVGNCFVPSIETYSAKDFFSWGAFLSPGAISNSRLYARYLYASQNRRELQKVQQLGEVTYMEEKRKEAIACISSHPKTFGLLTLRRLVFTWTGAWYIWPETLPSLRHLRLLAILVYTSLSVLAFLGLWMMWRGRPEHAIPFLVLFAFFPAIYCLTHTTFRYRYPIDPEILLVASLSVVTVLSKLRSAWARSIPDVRGAEL